MTKDELLKLIAESGYNIGYAAKKHLATYDMVEKLPGWISFISIAAGVIALFEPNLTKNWVSATFTIIGIGSLFFNFYSDGKQKYEIAGSELTCKFHELRALYRKVKSCAPGDDLSAYVSEHDAIQKSIFAIRINKQIFLSDWYAHYKFFWQSQTDWMNEQLKFRFVRDKLPLGFTVLAISILLLICASLINNAIDYIPACLGLK